jgi:hypothetical protein
MYFNDLFLIEHRHTYTAGDQLTIFIDVISNDEGNLPANHADLQVPSANLRVFNNLPSKQASITGEIVSDGFQQLISAIVNVISIVSISHQALKIVNTVSQIAQNQHVKPRKQRARAGCARAHGIMGVMPVSACAAGCSVRGLNADFPALCNQNWGIFSLH